MEIYFVRHAPAVQLSEEEGSDADRPLSDEGKLKIRKAAKGLRKFVDRFDKIYHSPLLRALQTAEIMAEELDCAETIEETKLALPGAKPKALMNFIGLFPSFNKIMIVGHEPSISIMASYLLGTEKSVIEFKKGAVCRIDVGPEQAFGSGQLIWHLTPKMLRKLA